MSNKIGFARVSFFHDSLTLASSTLVTVLLATSTDTSGSKAASTVSPEFPLALACKVNSTVCPDVINVSGHRLSTAEIESALILHKGVAETAVVGTADELTGQAVYAFVTLKPYVFFSPHSITDTTSVSLTTEFFVYFLFTLFYYSCSEFKYDQTDESGLVKELVLQVRKVIGPFAAPKKVFIVADLPKTRSGKIMRRIMRKIIAGEGDQLGDLSTLAEPGVVELIKQKVASA